jgi:hypothetical protein
VLHAELAEQFFVISTRVLEFRGGRNNANTRILAAADINEPIKDFGIIQFFFGATDRDDVATFGTINCTRSVPSIVFAGLIIASG